MKQETVRNPMLRVLELRDFRLLFAGSTTSLLGDQFALVATPWLVLQLTGDPLVLGIVLALEGLPRAVFMLVGGAITDRLSPRLIMLISDIVRFALTALMTLAILSGTVQTWMLYAFGLGFGLVAGFAIPAENTMVPMLVSQQDLQAGNSLMMGIVQLAGFIGPTVAGIIIGGYANSLAGVGLAFGIDAFSFAVSAVCLWLIRMGSRQSSKDEAEQENLWKSIVSGMRFLWTDTALRVMFLIIMAANFLIVGPLMVGIPVLASQRLPEGALAFGLLMSAYAGGNLGGMLLAGMLPRATGFAIRMILFGLLGGFGLVLGSLGFIPSTWADFGLLLVLGLGNGYFTIVLFTWIQTHTPKEMLGRMMSIVTFASTGLVPVSAAISGVVSRSDVTLLFACSGALILLVTAWAALQPALKTFSENIVATGESKADAEASLRIES